MASWLSGKANNLSEISLVPSDKSKHMFPSNDGKLISIFNPHVKPLILLFIERLRKIPAKIWLTCHETGIFEEVPGDLWDQYLAVVHQRQDKLLALLKEPKTMEEIVNTWIVYRRPREPRELFAFGEQAIMQKHLDVLMADSTVVEKDSRYYRAAK